MAVAIMPAINVRRKGEMACRLCVLSWLPMVCSLLRYQKVRNIPFDVCSDLRLRNTHASLWPAIPRSRAAFGKCNNFRCEINTLGHTKNAASNGK
jgi:hypothetical protein